MTITSIPSEVSYDGDDVSVSFPIPFVFDTSADLKVIQTDADGIAVVLSSGFSVSGGAGSTGTLTLSTALPNGETLTLLDDLERSQNIDYISNDAFPAESAESGFDRNTRISKRLHQITQRAIRVPDGDPHQGQDMEIPAQTTRAGKALAFDASGKPTVLSLVSSEDASLRADLASIIASKGHNLVGISETDAETAAGATIVNTKYVVAHPYRYATNTTQGETDMAAGIQMAFDVREQQHSQTYAIHNALKNRPLGVVYFPEADVMALGSGVTAPEGVFIEGNNSSLVALAGVSAGEMVTIQGNDTGAYYAGAHVGARNLSIDGNGNDPKAGLRLNIANWGHWENITVVDCDLNWVLEEIQYSTFINCRGNKGKVGWLLSARAANTDLTCIDNFYFGCSANLNENYGVWVQASTHSGFYGLDASRNGVCDILLGAQLTDYISAINVTAGGTGYTVSAQLPLTITDSGSGAEATGYAITDGAGIITAAYVGESGEDYDAGTTSVTVGGGGAGATFTVTVSTDVGLGYWDGATSIVREHNEFHGLKVEHSRDTMPMSGYVVWNRNNRNTIFYSPSFSRQSSGTAVDDEYLKWFRSDAFGGVIVHSPLDTALSTLLDNPSVSGDYSIFKSTVSQGIFCHWLGYPEPDQPYDALCVNVSNVVAADGKFSYMAYSGGRPMARGFEAVPAIAGGVVLSSIILGEADDRLRVRGDGEIRWGDGTNPYDVSLKRDAEASLYAVGRIGGDYIGMRTATTAELVAIADAVNTSPGKVNGAMVFNTTTDKPVIATGASDAAVWVDATGATVHSPA